MIDKTPIKQGEQLLQFIPQREPFLMVDKLYEVAGKTVVSGLTISETNTLVEQGRFMESGLIENMAQTCALFAGCRAQEMGQGAPVGFIAGLKNVVIKRLPSVNEDIFTTMEITNEMMNMQIAMASVYDKDEKLLAGCELRIFINET